MKSPVGNKNLEELILVGLSGGKWSVIEQADKLIIFVNAGGSRVMIRRREFVYKFWTL